MYTYAVLSLGFCFVTFLLCIRFSFAKRSYIWVVSCLLCIVLGLVNLAILMALGSADTVESVRDFAFRLSQPLCILSGIWFLCVVFFRMRTNKIRRAEIKKMQEAYEKAYMEHFANLMQEQAPKGQVRAVHLPKADLSEESL